VEFDELEINYRNADVGQRVDSLTSRSKGYWARGRLTQRVPLRKPVSELRALPTEPRDGRVDLVP
jgi:hypothetical protein